MRDSRARGWSGSLGLDVVLYAMSALCRIGDKDEAVGRGHLENHPLVLSSN